MKLVHFLIAYLKSYVKLKLNSVKICKIETEKNKGTQSDLR